MYQVGSAPSSSWWVAPTIQQSQPDLKLLLELTAATTACAIGHLPMIILPDVHLESLPVQIHC